MKKVAAFILLSSSILLTACNKTDALTGDSSSSGNSTDAIIGTASTVSTAVEGNTDSAYNADDLIANSSFTSTVTIAFGSTVTITNPLASSGVDITESNGDVVVTSTAKAVEYVVTGSTTNGSVKFYSDNKFKLTLNGATITNNDGPTINIQSGKRVFVELAAGTTNTLTDAAAYATSTNDEDMKATLFSEGQLIFTGTGTLAVKGNYKHAICSDDYMRIQSGTINITGAVSDGIHTNEAIVIDGGILTVSTAGDGIQCEEGYIVINDGNINVTAADKGISAAWDTDTSIDPFITINGGTIKVVSTAGEGIESKSILTINNGNITVNATDDGLNAGTFIYINGGSTYVTSTGNDGIDSNGKITVTGGQTVSVGAASPEEGFDCDNNTFKITGGIIVGVAGATSSPTASVSTQPSVILGSGTANQLINIQAADGTEALTFLAPKSFTTMLFSSPKLKSGTAYTVYSGGTVTNGTEVNNLYTAGTYAGGVSSKTFTTTSMVTSAGGSTGR